LEQITTRNPQANVIVERVHQTIGKTFNVQTVDSDEPWTGMPAATMFTCHTALEALPMQLVFAQDAILNIKHASDRERIQRQKQTRIEVNNKREKHS
jgi:hypothetical protein